MKLHHQKINRAFLESGSDLKLTETVIVKHPTVGEILQLGNGIRCEEVYWQYVFSLLCDPYDNMVWLDDLGLDYEAVTPFDVFILRWNACKHSYLEHKQEYDSSGLHPLDSIRDALLFFLGPHDFEVGSYDVGGSVLFDRAAPQAYQIDGNCFSCLTAFLQGINGIQQNGRIHPVDQNAKRILVEDMRSQQKSVLRRSQKEDEDDDYLGQMITAVLHGGNGGVTPFNVHQLKIYSLYSAYRTMQKKDTYHQIMSGVYHGTLSWDSVNKQELIWMK